MRGDTVLFLLVCAPNIFYFEHWENYFYHKKDPEKIFTVYFEVQRYSRHLEEPLVRREVNHLLGDDWELLVLSRCIGVCGEQVETFILVFYLSIIYKYLSYAQPSRYFESKNNT